MEAVALVGQDQRRRADRPVRFRVVNRCCQETPDCVDDRSGVLGSQPGGTFLRLFWCCRKSGHPFRELCRLFETVCDDGCREQLQRLDGTHFLWAPQRRRAERWRNEQNECSDRFGTLDGCPEGCSSAHRCATHDRRQTAERFCQPHHIVPERLPRVCSRVIWPLGLAVATGIEQEHPHLLEDG